MRKSETLGQRLRHLRRAADVTQERLAAQTGLAVSSIRNWEQDHRTPNVFALLKIARALGLRMEDFVDGAVHSKKAAAERKYHGAPALKAKVGSARTRRAKKRVSGNLFQ
jgi:transcriptional regulator with XRE-family HTH domain